MLPTLGQKIELLSGSPATAVTLFGVLVDGTVRVAVGETVTLPHPPLHLAGVSTGV